MAKTNMIEREKRRAKIVKKYAAKRALLKELIRSPKTNPEVRADAQQRLSGAVIFDERADVNPRPPAGQHADVAVVRPSFVDLDDSDRP